MGTLRIKPPTLPQSVPISALRWRINWNWRHAFLHLFLLSGAVVMLLPFFWMVSTSLKDASEVLTTTPTFWPRIWRWDNYVEVFTQVPFARFYFNTVFVSSARVVGQLLIASMAGFGFARLHFPGRDYLFIAVLAVMMIPSQVTLVPNYVLLKHLGWLDSYQGLIIPSLFSAFGTFLLRQFFLTLPKDLEDAAVLDGCNPLQVYWHIGLPLARPALVAFGLIVALWSWNDFLWPLIITNSTDMQMLSVGMAYFRGQYVSSVSVMMAAATVTTLPMVVAFLFVQRQLIEGITMTGIRG